MRLLVSDLVDTLLTATRDTWRRSPRLVFSSLGLLIVAACNSVTVDPDAGLPLAQSFWKLLQLSDVPKTVELYDPSIWRGDPAGRSRWSEFLTGLQANFGPVVSKELRGKKWFPGSILVPDHRAFVCYAYDYDVHRTLLVSRERLVICGDHHAATSDMRVYGHSLTRQDTQQSIKLGVDVTEKAL